MTDGQWLYLIANLNLDDEEEFNKLCTTCKSKSKEVKCNGCGKAKDQEVNPHFDNEYFEKLKKQHGGE
jgi:hypothetical protein